MDRREVLQLFGIAAALPFLPSSAEATEALGQRLHAVLREGAVFRTLNEQQRELVTVLAESIIPATDTPGATDVQVPQFIDLLITDWMDEAERAKLLAGLGEIDERARRAGGASFAQLAAAPRAELLKTLDSIRHQPTGAGFAFGRVKALTVYGYFTSARVQRDVLRTRIFFQGYDGNAPFPPAR